jgi:hypothetical protein
LGFFIPGLDRFGDVLQEWMGSSQDLHSSILSFSRRGC